MRKMARILFVPSFVRRWLCAAHLVVIAVLSLMPAWLFPATTPHIPGLDQVVHFAMYGVLGALLRWAAGARPGWQAHLGWPLAAGAYGLLLEILQPALGGGRGFSWGDAGMDLLGAALLWFGTGWLLARQSSPAG